jgi:hypothetical protein
MKINIKAKSKIKNREIKYPIIMESTQNGDIVMFLSPSSARSIATISPFGTYNDSNITIDSSFWVKFEGTIELSND